MPNSRQNAAIIGLLFILAAITSIIGLKLYDPLLQTSDYLTKGFENEPRIVLGALFEMVLAVSVVATAIMLFPYFKKENEGLAIAYVCFRVLEAIFIIIGIVSVLALLALSQEYINTAGADSGHFTTTGSLLKAVHSRTFMLGPNFMLALNTVICSYLLYKSLLVPRFISAMGLTGSIFIFYAAVLEMFGIIEHMSNWGIILAVPLFSYEMILALWLLFKGFNASAFHGRKIILQT